MLPDASCPPTIPTERLRLRWLTASDVPALAAIFGDAEVCRYWSRPADVDARNERSIRALERLGFEREGHLRERYHVNGERQDAVLYGLLRPDWIRRQSTRP